jgi:DNA-binding GntR family transcriptional regulator
MTTPADRPSDPVARNVLSAQVKDRILQWILEGELAPGSRIVETRVARELGTSQAPVREALRDLATLGVVEMQAYRGARVRRPTKQELVEAMEVRAELEAMAARLAAPRMTEACLDELRGLMDEMGKWADSGDAHEHALSNTEFHAAVVRASGNRTLERTWSMLEPFARTYVTATVPGIDLHWLGRRHLPIFEALEARDPERAAATMREHAKEAEALVGEMVDTPNEREEEVVGT